MTDTNGLDLTNVNLEYNALLVANGGHSVIIPGQCAAEVVDHANYFVLVFTL